MRFGPTLIKQCSQCMGHIEQQTLMSGNTIGATNWTDGKVEAPMMPSYSSVIKCPHCTELLWLSKQETVAEVDRSDAAKSSSSSKPYHNLKIADYWLLLESGKFEKEEERYLRLSAWWSGNDKRRGSEIKSTLSSKEIANLKALETLMDLSYGPDRIMVAEIKRELCEFDESEKLLVEVLSGEFEHAATTIADLAIRKDPYVAPIEDVPFEPPRNEDYIDLTSKPKRRSWKQFFFGDF